VEIKSEMRGWFRIIISDAELFALDTLVNLGILHSDEIRQYELAKRGTYNLCKRVLAAGNDFADRAAVALGRQKKRSGKGRRANARRGVSDFYREVEKPEGGNGKV